MNASPVHTQVETDIDGGGRKENFSVGVVGEGMWMNGKHRYQLSQSHCAAQTSDN
jgi:hypothetical protein